MKITEIVIEFEKKEQEVSSYHVLQDTSLTNFFKFLSKLRAEKDFRNFINIKFVTFDKIWTTYRMDDSDINWMNRDFCGCKYCQSIINKFFLVPN